MMAAAHRDEITLNGIRIQYMNIIGYNCIHTTILNNECWMNVGVI